MQQTWDPDVAEGGRVARYARRRRSTSLGSLFGGSGRRLRTNPVISPAEYAESDDERARRYLTEARLTLHAVEGDRILATCRGHRGSYGLGYNAEAGWWCHRQAERDCAHLRALRLVADPAVFSARSR